MNVVVVGEDLGERVTLAARPKCGRDFCDRCGCCLHCFPDCCTGGCSWVVYADIDPERAAELRAEAAA